MLELNITLLVDETDESLLPGEEFDDPDIGKDLVGGMDTCVGSRQDELLNLGELACNVHVDRKKNDHHTNTGNTTVAKDSIQKDDCNHDLNGGISPQEVQVGTNLADFEGVDSHEVNNSSGGDLSI